MAMRAWALLWPLLTTAWLLPFSAAGKLSSGAFGGQRPRHAIKSPAARALGPALLVCIAVGVAGVLVVGLAVAPRPRRRINLRTNLERSSKGRCVSP